MPETCMVFIDQNMTGEPFKFASVPRAGDMIQIDITGPDSILTVDKVVFVARGVLNDGHETQIYASSRAKHVRRNP